MDLWLAAVDKVLPEKKISDEVYDKCRDYMKQSFIHSIYKVFHEYPFYKQMPPRLKDNVFKICMSEEVRTMSFFFRDKARNTKSERGLMRKIVCGLNCSFYDPSQVVVESGK
jgi:hypothetical protein